MLTLVGGVYVHGRSVGASRGLKSLPIVSVVKKKGLVCFFCFCLWQDTSFSKVRGVLGGKMIPDRGHD